MSSVTSDDPFTSLSRAVQGLDPATFGEIGNRRIRAWADSSGRLHGAQACPAQQGIGRLLVADTSLSNVVLRGEPADACSCLYDRNRWLHAAVRALDRLSWTVTTPDAVTGMGPRDVVNQLRAAAHADLTGMPTSELQRAADLARKRLLGDAAAAARSAAADLPWKAWAGLWACLDEARYAKYVDAQTTLDPDLARVLLAQIAWRALDTGEPLSPGVVGPAIRATPGSPHRRGVGQAAQHWFALLHADATRLQRDADPVQLLVHEDLTQGLPTVPIGMRPGPWSDIVAAVSVRSLTHLSFMGWPAARVDGHGHGAQCSQWIVTVPASIGTTAEQAAPAIAEVVGGADTDASAIASLYRSGMF